MFALGVLRYFLKTPTTVNTLCEIQATRRGHVHVLWWPLSHLSQEVHFVTEWVFMDARSQLQDYQPLSCVWVETADVMYRQAILAVPWENWWPIDTIQLKKYMDVSSHKFGVICYVEVVARKILYKNLWKEI